MARTKSQNDIKNQAYRLSMSTSDYNRQQRIWAIRSRYLKNIDNLRSKEDQWEDRRTFHLDRKTFDKRIKEKMSKQHTRRQYMGLNNG